MPIVCGQTSPILWFRKTHRREVTGEGRCYENPLKHLGEKHIALDENTLKSPPISLLMAPESFCVDRQEKKKNRLDTPLVLAECPGRCLF